MFGLSLLHAMNKTETARKVEEVLQKVPELRKYVRVVEVCFDYDTDHPSCRDADYEWQCPCAVEGKDVEGELPKEVFLNVASKLTVEEAKTLLRFVKTLFTVNDEKLLCEVDGYAVTAFIPYDSSWYEYSFWRVYELKTVDGYLKVYEPVDKIPGEALAKCLQRLRSHRDYPEFVTDLIEHLPADAARKFVNELVSKMYDRLSPAKIRKFVELGLLSRSEALDVLRKIVEQWTREKKWRLTSPEKLEEIKKNAKTVEEKYSRMIGEAKRIVETLRRELRDLPVEVRADPDPGKLRIEYEENTYCLEGGYVVDEEKLDVEWRCRREVRLKWPRLTDGEGRTVVRVKIEVYSRGYMRRSDFQKYLRTVKRMGLRYCPKDKAWRIEVTEDGLEAPWGCGGRRSREVRETPDYDW